MHTTTWINLKNIMLCHNWFHLYEMSRQIPIERMWTDLRLVRAETAEGGVANGYTTLGWRKCAEIDCGDGYITLLYAKNQNTIWIGELYLNKAFYKKVLLIIHATWEMNFQIIMMNERGRPKKNTWFHLHKTPENANWSLVTEWSIVTWGLETGNGRRRGLARDTEKLLGGGYKYIHYLNHGEVHGCKGM